MIIEKKMAKYSDIAKKKEDKSQELTFLKSAARMLGETGT